jgi:integrase
VSPRALEFAILTGARTGEVIGARWGEIDMATKLWTLLARRMKAGKEHRVTAKHSGDRHSRGNETAQRCEHRG